MPLTCMIVDDEPLAVRLLVSYVEKTPDLQLLSSFTDSISAINAVREQKPDLLFLDIQMPNLDGMELAHSLPEQTRVVFTTAFKEYAFESPSATISSWRLWRKPRSSCHPNPKCPNSHHHSKIPSLSVSMASGVTS